MSFKQTFSLTTLASGSEQTGAAPITVTATGTSRQYRELGSFWRAILFLDVSAVSGTTPSLTVALETQDQQSGKWAQLAAFPAQTAITGATPITPVTTELYGVNFRLSWTVSGTTPSFTFTCNAVASSDVPT
jgi:hypothetical protein